jgi:hypothetical protein
MTLKLINKQFRDDGIFGTLLGEDGKQLAVTLTHAYDKKPKTPNGTYTCLRGTHRLHSMNHDFETFEIRNVPDHTDILFHFGNFNKDSDGCYLLGKAIESTAVQKTQIITESIKTFNAFMEYLKGVDEFTLEISSVPT